MEDDAQRVALAGVYGADAVFHGYAVVAVGAFDGPEVGGEQEHIALAGLEHDSPGLRSGALFREYELAAGIVFTGFVEEEDELYREEEIAVEVLVERVVTAFAVLQDEDGGLCLSFAVAEGLQCLEFRRVSAGNVERFHPGIGDGSQVRVYGFAYLLYD